ncbi:hypothetical protein SKAU_G00217880 [Synaphobranchus kaupii]|uniref:Uncharacterized protein n=1 Tax=Synaphobranchus kaupii TaxID=118154 RepID=A0A9Q1FA64_SYNKA|nr:hypothetical protein SKAU_G00217880 [Synaphobranchus kaupii]
MHSQLQRNKDQTNDADNPPKTAILIDSNGKLLNHRQLFPCHRVTHTDSALQLLCQDHQGDPDNIIIHTGTNNLHRKGQHISEAVVKVAIKAHGEFPRAKITISPLLPQTDFPFDLITKINRDITTECTKLTSVNIAHHPTLTHEHLYYHVHLSRENVWMFAEDQRDNSQRRSSSHTSHERNTTTGPETPPHATHMKGEENLAELSPSEPSPAEPSPVQAGQTNFQSRGSCATLLQLRLDIRQDKDTQLH